MTDTRVQPRYTLEELLAHCDAGTNSPEEDREWLEMLRMGREL